MIREDEITLEDVKIAIKILKVWIKRTKEAEKLLKYMARSGFSTSGPRGDLFKWIMEQSITAPVRAVGEEVEEEEEELTGEELERLRSIAESYKPKKSSIDS